MDRNVVVNVPAHLVVSVFVGLGLWLLVDGDFAYAYTCGAIIPILILALGPQSPRTDT